MHNCNSSQAGMFIGWVLSLREIAKFPNCGIYSAILKKVLNERV